jgi:hypothetical protein
MIIKQVEMEKTQTYPTKLIGKQNYNGTRKPVTRNLD